MMIRILLIVSIAALSMMDCSGQAIQELVSGTTASLRGLSVVNNKVVWVSGSSGTVGRSIDGGNTWEWRQVAGYENRDFRDIEAFDKSVAVIMAVDTPAILLRTENGGASWKSVYENKTAGMFLDAMEFWNSQSGIVIGDPVNGKFFVARSFDGGKRWREIPFNNLPDAKEGEACFAASGTNVRALDRDEACFVSGGSVSRFFWKNTPVDLPLIQGKESTGANSVAVWSKGYKTPHIMVVGGDFLADTVRSRNAVLSRDGGRSWIYPSNPPNGYRSCVEFLNAEKIITCGINGVDISLDEGINWNSISQVGYNVCNKAKHGDAVFLAGEKGRVGVLTWNTK